LQKETSENGDNDENKLIPQRNVHFFSVIL